MKRKIIKWIWPTWSDALQRKNCCFNRRSFPPSVVSPGYKTAQIYKIQILS